MYEYTTLYNQLIYVATKLLGLFYQRRPRRWRWQVIDTRRYRLLWCYFRFASSLSIIFFFVSFAFNDHQVFLIEIFLFKNWDGAEPTLCSCQDFQKMLN
jgi:hypothetical protein